jgi:hypothetical protein
MATQAFGLRPCGWFTAPKLYAKAETRAAPFSLAFGAPVTAQFVVEDHALRQSWHHLARIRAALGR